MASSPPCRAATAGGARAGAAPEILQAVGRLSPHGSPSFGIDVGWHCVPRRHDGPRRQPAARGWSDPVSGLPLGVVPASAWGWLIRLWPVEHGERRLARALLRGRALALEDLGGIALGQGPIGAGQLIIDQRGLATAQPLDRRGQRRPVLARHTEVAPEVEQRALAHALADALGGDQAVGEVVSAIAAAGACAANEHGRECGAAARARQGKDHFLWHYIRQPASPTLTDQSVTRAKAPSSAQNRAQSAEKTQTWASVRSGAVDGRRSNGGSSGRRERGCTLTPPAYAKPMRR